MTRIALVLGMVGLLAAEAQAAPSSMSFAGRLSTTAGPVNGPVSVTFSVHSAATGGIPVWTDTYNLTADQGLVFATLGSTTNPLDDTVFAGAGMFLEITVQSEILTPRLPIGSSPYAIRSSSAEVADRADLLGTLAPSQVVTAVTAGTGLTGGGSGGAVSLSINTSAVQARVNGNCPVGQSIRVISDTGTVTCEADDNTVPTAGPGIAVAGAVVSLATCPNGQILKSTGANWTCQADNDTTYSAGTGLSLTGTQFAIDSNIVARKDGAAGNQAFDTNTLFLDYGNNRVGVGTATPGVLFDVGGVARAQDLQYTAPVAGQAYASPNYCTRSLGATHAETEAISPPSNNFGPSISDLNETPNTNAVWNCPVFLPVPPGGTVTITNATLAFVDGSPNCRVQADLRFKTFGISNGGTLLASIFSGVDANDFAAAPNLSTKAAAITASAMGGNIVVFVVATIQQNPTGGGDCRYSGVLIDYTVTHP